MKGQVQIKMKIQVKCTYVHTHVKGMYRSNLRKYVRIYVCKCVGTDGTYVKGQYKYSVWKSKS